MLRKVRDLTGYSPDTAWSEWEFPQNSVTIVGVPSEFQKEPYRIQGRMHTFCPNSFGGRARQIEGTGKLLHTDRTRQLQTELSHHARD